MFRLRRVVAAFSIVSFAILMLSGPASAGSVGTSVTGAQYIVFAWNDLGMHCLNPTYDKAVILPPYNNLIVQVVKRGDPPAVVTTGLTVSYRIINNTKSSTKASYGQFWTNAAKLFGVSLPVDTGLNLVDPYIHNGLSGNMVVHGSQFEADGIPVTPVDDSNVWNPYQVAEITVKDSTGKIVAQTRTTIPTSDEINCAKCHGSTDAFGDILRKHDSMHGTNLAGQAPVLCQSCHADPILGTTNHNGATGYFSAAMHKSHSTRGATCYDCHPGNKTQCSRSIAHTAPGGNCETCHGSMANVADSILTGGRIPWTNEPKCVSCHSGVAEVDSGNTLFRNALGHGGMHCTACHGSPHAMVPSSQSSDNYQSTQYQGAVKTIASCGACHSNSRGAGLSEYLSEHGYLNPQRPNGCNICHTQITTTDTTRWPHDYQWKDSNSTSGGTSGGGTGGGTSGGTITNTIGATLYGQYCQNCHGQLATSEKRGATPQQIQTGISQVSGMKSLSFLTTLQVQQISQALGGYTATIPGTTTTGGSTGGTTTLSATIKATYSTVWTGSSDKFTATATGGKSPYQYQFLLNGPGTGGRTVVKRSYSTTNTWTWKPGSSDIGTSTVTVRVRNSGSTATYDAQASTQVTVTRRSSN